jgi:hypothetical protein
MPDPTTCRDLDPPLPPTRRSSEPFALRQLTVANRRFGSVRDVTASPRWRQLLPKAGIRALPSGRRCARESALQLLGSLHGSDAPTSPPEPLVVIEHGPDEASD